MKKILFITSLLYGIAAQAETLTVATFNAEFLFPSRVHVKYGLNFNMSRNTPAEQAQWAPPAFRSTQFDAAVDTVAEFLATAETDVLTLTEVGKGADLTALVNALETNGADYPFVEVCDCNDGIGQNVAILSKHSFVGTVVKSIPGREVYDLESDDPDEQKDTGISKGLRATIEIDGEKIHIYVVHLASEREGHEKDQQRIAQATIVRRHALSAINANEHVIITGDLNDRRGQPTLRRLRGLDDIWPDLIQTGNYKYFDKGEEASRWTYEFRGELNQIDHILLSYGLRKNQTSSIRTKVIDVPDGDDPSISDHRPLIVEIDLP